MSFYETTFIARQDITSQEVEKITSEFEELIKENKGSVVKKEYWGLKSLAYKVNKNKKGHYVHLGIEIAGDALKKLNRQFKLSEDVIRNMSVKVDEISKEPTAILKNNSKKTSN